MYIPLQRILVVWVVVMCSCWRLCLLNDDNRACLQASSNRNGSQKVRIGAADMPAEVLLNIFRHLGSCVTANSKAFLPKHSSTVSNALAHTAAPSPLLLASQVCKQWRALIYGASIEHVVAQGVTLSLPACSLPLYSAVQSIRLDSCMFSTDLSLIHI